jgi:methionine-R-sulfoxide reductase
MPDTSFEPGILEQLAPDLGVTQWVDAAGQPLPGFGLDRMRGRYKLLFCFQHACPGCHTRGFPTLARLVQRLHSSEILGLAAVQTVFEEFEHNTYEAMLADQRRYALPIPFGHDAGQGRPDAGSVLMQRYRSGGTPWFIVIDPQNVVAFNGFHLDAERLIELLERMVAEGLPAAAPPGTLTWRGVLELVRDGNPPPPRRVELSEAQWRERLTPEQFHVTRRKGTERAHSSSMCALFEPGRYHCACCDTPLFDATSKFDSASGWPSFTQALTPGVVAYHADNSHGMQRIETACNVCDAHLGHVFPDGPLPSGLRYCINAAALVKP